MFNKEELKRDMIWYYLKLYIVDWDECNNCCRYHNGGYCDISNKVYCYSFGHINVFSIFHEKYNTFIDSSYNKSLLERVLI